MNYQEWTWQDVQHRIIEAAETVMRCPPDRGPRSYGSAWPEHILDYGRPSHTRLAPSAAALSRMVECWDWINSLPDDDRFLVYGWAAVKASKGRSVEDFADEQDIRPRTLRWRLTTIFKEIAGNLNRSYSLRLKAEVDVVAENLAHERPDRLPKPVRKSPRRMMQPDAKPDHLPGSVDHKALIKRLEKQNRRRRRSVAKSG